MQRLRPHRGAVERVGTLPALRATGQEERTSPKAVTSMGRGAVSECALESRLRDPVEFHGRFDVGEHLDQRIGAAFLQGLHDEAGKTCNTGV